MGHGVVARRAGDDPRDEGRLARAQLLRARALRGPPAARVVLAEVRLRGGLDPVGAVAEVDRVEVLLQDLLLAPAAREVVGQRGLAELLEDRALRLRLERVLDELLGDRRAALGRALADDVLGEGAGDAAEVDAVVRREALVLHGDDRGAHGRGDVVVLDEDAVLVGDQAADPQPVDVDEGRVAGVRRRAVLRLVLERREVGGDRHHHPEHGRDARQQGERHEDEQEPQLLHPRALAGERLVVGGGADAHGRGRRWLAARRAPPSRTGGAGAGTGWQDPGPTEAQTTIGPDGRSRPERRLPRPQRGGRPPRRRPRGAPGRVPRARGASCGRSSGSTPRPPTCTSGTRSCCRSCASSRTSATASCSSWATTPPGWGTPRGAPRPAPRSRARRSTPTRRPTRPRRSRSCARSPSCSRCGATRSGSTCAWRSSSASRARRRSRSCWSATTSPSASPRARRSPCSSCSTRSCRATTPWRSARTSSSGARTRPSTSCSGATSSAPTACPSSAS